jgi:tripartite-type tricarboxylate transporter receptor subunit TctC
MLVKPSPYEFPRDFEPIGQATTAPYIVVVHPSLPVKSVKELIALWQDYL